MVFYQWHEHETFSDEKCSLTAVFHMVYQSVSSPQDLFLLFWRLFLLINSTSIFLAFEFLTLSGWFTGYFECWLAFIKLNLHYERH